MDTKPSKYSLTLGQEDGQQVVRVARPPPPCILLVNMETLVKDGECQLPGLFTFLPVLYSQSTWEEKQCRLAGEEKKRSVAATRGVRSDLPWIDYRLWLVWSADANWRPCCKTENVAPAGCWRWNKHKTAAHARSQYWRVHLIMFFNEIDVRKALVTDKTCMFTVDKGKQNSRDMLTNTTA